MQEKVPNPLKCPQVILKKEKHKNGSWKTGVQTDLQTSQLIFYTAGLEHILSSNYTVTRPLPQLCPKEMN